MGKIYSEVDEDLIIWLGHDQKGVNVMGLIRDWPGPPVLGQP